MARIPIDGLGMDEKAMLELVNRMNAHDTRKWVLERAHGGCGYGYNQAFNCAPVTPLYQSQLAQ
jgi:hypothetical protein